MIINNFNWKIGGEAGYGIISVGAMFSRAMLRSGFYVFDHAEYPSLIRGGHNTLEVSVSDEKIYAVRRPINILVALNQETVDFHKNELSEDAAIIYNSDNAKAEDKEFPEPTEVIGIPLDDLAVKAGAKEIARNVVALGASFGLLNLPFDALKNVIEFNFKKKGDQVINTNVSAALAGYNFIKNNVKKEFNYRAEPQKNPDRMILNGNDGIVWGAIQAGCKFVSAYPMTPASGIMQGIAKQSRKYNIVVKHTEDEISAINTAIGAAYTGVRALSASSGGGFALMVEAWGMAAMVEVPLVVVEAMRTGPSTGMPTWTGQGDLKFLLSASQGEFPRFVIAPGDVEQCFNLIQQAFNLAEKYQTPVMFITDKHLAVSHKWVENLDLEKEDIERGSVVAEKDLNRTNNYRRYIHTESGVSPRTLPGTKGGMHVANSDEHNEKGFSEKGAEERKKMMDKRFRKEEAARGDFSPPKIEGDKNADITLISWGSTRGTILEAMKVLKKEGKKINFLQIVYISPFPVEEVKAVFKRAKKVAIVENNKTGQLAGWLREQTGLVPDYKILKYDGRPFFTEELVETIKELK